MQGQRLLVLHFCFMECPVDRLWDAFIDSENLWNAWTAVRRKDSGPGLDGQTVDDFECCAPTHLTDLRRELRCGRYAPQPLRGVYIPKANGGWRKVGIPVVRDRVAQRACLNMLLPLLDRQLESCSYAYRPGRSVNDAILQIERWRDTGHDYLLDADIQDCFDSIDRELLLETLRRYVPDKRFVELIRRWCEAGTVWPQSTDDLPLVAPCGIPQGNVVSPLLCNLFLDAFDEAMLRQRFKLVRYCDDFVVLATRPERAAAAMTAARAQLAGIGLRLHPGKSRVASFDDGFRYLGTEFLGDLTLGPTPCPGIDSPDVPTRFIATYPTANAPASNISTPRPAPPVARGIDAVTSALATGSPKLTLPMAEAFERAVHTKRTRTRRALTRESVLPFESNYLV